MEVLCDLAALPPDGVDTSNARASLDKRRISREHSSRDDHVAISLGGYGPVRHERGQSSFTFSDLVLSAGALADSTPLVSRGAGIFRARVDEDVTESSETRPTLVGSGGSSMSAVSAVTPTQSSEALRPMLVSPPVAAASPPIVYGPLLAPAPLASPVGGSPASRDTVQPARASPKTGSSGGSASSPPVAGAASWDRPSFV